MILHPWTILWRGQRLGCLDLVVCEAEKVECGHIIVHHPVNSNVIHYSSDIFSERRVIRDDVHREKTHLSPSGGCDSDYTTLACRTSSNIILRIVVDQATPKTHRLY